MSGKELRKISGWLWRTGFGAVLATRGSAACVGKSTELADPTDITEAVGRERVRGEVLLKGASHFLSLRWVVSCGGTQLLVVISTLVLVVAQQINALVGAMIFPLFSRTSSNSAEASMLGAKVGVLDDWEKEVYPTTTIRVSFFKGMSRWNTMTNNIPVAWTKSTSFIEIEWRFPPPRH